MEVTNDNLLKVLQAKQVLHLETVDLRERTSLDVTNVKGHEVILGTPRLAKHNPRVKWRSGFLWLTFRSKEEELKPASKVRNDGARIGAR